MGGPEGIHAGNRVHAGLTLSGLYFRSVKTRRPCHEYQLQRPVALQETIMDAATLMHPAPIQAVRIPRATPCQLARISGVLYLICIASGFFAELIVREKLIVLSDAATTASKIMAEPALYRMGFFADFVALTAGMVIAVLFYRLLKPLSPTLALLDLMLAIVSNVVSIVALILLFAPLILLNGGPYWKALQPAQLQELALLSIRLYELGYAINLMLFGLECLVAGYLIFKSTFLPRILGALLAVGGVCYVINSFVDFMPAHFADFLFPYILLPSLLAETLLALWLTIVGLNNAKWYAVAQAR
jgi:Domain of unknown function (DUF4386)